MHQELDVDKGMLGAFKERYAVYEEEETIPRTFLVREDEDKVKNIEDLAGLAQKEALWLGTLDIKKPENEFSMKPTPTPPDTSREPYVYQILSIYIFTL